MVRVGFIGAGNIASAILSGMKTGGMDMENISVFSVIQKEVDALKQDLGIRPASSNREVLQHSKYIFMAIRPEHYRPVMEEVGDLITPEHVFISPTPGYTIGEFQQNFGQNIRVIRIMPNTPAMVAQGMTGVCIPESGFQETERDEILQILNSFGRTLQLPEEQIDMIVSVCGSSPAYIYMMIEAMGDAAAAIGLTRRQAYYLAAQAMIGAATMVRDTGLHPGELKDRVCSPGGTTIQAVRVLEEKGFRSSLIEAMLKCHYAAEDSKR